MDLETQWNTIRKHFNTSFASNLHVAVASVNAEGLPTVTPIGSLFLNNNQTGFYFEKYTSKLPTNAKHNPNVCILGVNSSKLFWLLALFKKKFSSNPAVKLYGTLGERREATPKEIARLQRRMKLTKGLKGHSYLWGDMKYVRVIRFTKAEQIRLGTMTDLS